MKSRLEETNHMRKLMGLDLITENILSLLAPAFIAAKSVIGLEVGSLHIRNALRFLMVQKDKSTNSDYSDDEINFIAAIVCEKSKKKGGCNPKNWGMVMTPDDYGLKYNGNNTYTQNIDNMDELSRSVSLGLGSSTIVDNGDNWKLTDFYDFDNARKFKNNGGEDRKKIYDSLLNLPDDMLNNIKGLVGDDKTKYIERMMAWIHSFGYKGFPIELTIPKKNCEYCNSSK